MILTVYRSFADRASETSTIKLSTIGEFGKQRRLEKTNKTQNATQRDSNQSLVDLSERERERETERETMVADLLLCLFVVVRIS